jgi:hypothetical protein
LSSSAAIFKHSGKLAASFRSSSCFRHGSFVVQLQEEDQFHQTFGVEAFFKKMKSLYRYSWITGELTTHLTWSERGDGGGGGPATIVVYFLWISIATHPCQSHLQQISNKRTSKLHKIKSL